MSNEAGPSKRRRMLPTTELEDTASEGSARQCSKCSYILQISHFASARRPSVLTKTCERCQNYGRQVPRQRQNRGSSPDNIRGPSEHNRLATRPLRNKNAAGDLIETTAPPGQYGAIEEKQY
ncbi:hypothetical protein E4U12_007905 [Claviceps purpurea]|nr:hypothetical protein E4U12_007905 [Claviceps purpurea]